MTIKYTDFDSTEVNFSRRSMLKSGISVTTGCSIFGLAACSSEEAAPQPAEESTVSKPPAPFFDLHSHMHFRATSDGWGERAERSLVSGLGGALFSLVPDIHALKLTPVGPAPTRELEPGEGWNVYQRQLETLRQSAESSNIELTTERPSNSEDARDAIAGLISCEGGHMPEGKLERLEQLHADGVRSLQLMHYVPSELGDDQTNEPRFGGLSDFGRDVVREANRLGIVIDVAHASMETVEQVADLTDQPIILSHTILQHESIPGPLLKRAVSVEHARLVSETGGVIGLWPVIRTIPEMMALRAGQTVDFASVHGDALRLLDAVGVDHVGLGSDINGGPIVMRDYSELERWAEGIATELNEDEMDNVRSGNAWRVLGNRAV